MLDYKYTYLRFIAIRMGMCGLAISTPLYDDLRMYESSNKMCLDHLKQERVETLPLMP